MPPEQRIRRSDGGDLAQPAMADANRPYRQTAPVGVGQAEASRAELARAPISTRCIGDW